ncbi:hypothetical protein Z947_2678 [Sulfitobacter geojensis]|nr:hypothetical protein Z947_2678 [Sulfitobacter geojensis]NYI29767.1 hypothetical protein [Sulfitobacter geojensis]
MTQTDLPILEIGDLHLRSAEVHDGKRVLPADDAKGQAA